MQLKLNYMLTNVHIPELNRDFLGTIGNYLYLCNRYLVRTENKKQGGTEIIPIPILFTPQSYGIFLVSPSFLTKI